MLKVDPTIIDQITEQIYRMLHGENAPMVNLPEDHPNDEIRQMVNFFNKMVQQYNDSSDFMFALARGDLDYKPPKGNLRVIHSFKTLQSHLRHLTWQTQQIAKGDFNQQVDFMGDFSKAFNSMTRQLADAFEEIEAKNKDLITARDKMIRQARMAALGNLASGVTHEIGNPLNSIMAGFQVLNKSIDDLKCVVDSSPLPVECKQEIWNLVHKTERARFLIQEGNRRIESIISNLRSFLKGRSPRNESYDITAGVQSCAALLSERLRIQGISVVIDFEELPPISSRPGEINQVITNLLVNSCDAMPSGGTIKIEGRLVDQEVEVCFSDTGPGVPAEHRASIFDAFFSTKDPSQATGLGLYISHEIITNHSGSLILLDSEAGAQFRLRLPLVQV